VSHDFLCFSLSIGVNPFSSDNFLNLILYSYVIFLVLDLDCTEFKIGSVELSGSTSLSYQSGVL